MSEAMLQILLAVIGLLGVIVTSVVVPYVKSKTTNEQRENVEYWTSIAVQFIEQYYEDFPGQGAVKKEFVVEFMNKHGFKITTEQLDLLIEVIVDEMNKAKEDFIMLE